MADDRDRLPKPLDCANIISWAEWKQNFLVWMIANKRIDYNEKTKIATFVVVIGYQGRSIYNTLFPNDGSEKSMLGEIVVGDIAGVIQRTLVDVIKKFDEFCLPKRNVAMESFKFNTIVQKEKQQFIEFETELRKQLPVCEFKFECGASYENRMLRDRIIIGVPDKKLQLKLLDGRDETSTKILETCKIYESAHVKKSILDSKPTTASISMEETQQADRVNAINRVCFNVVALGIRNIVTTVGQKKVRVTNVGNVDILQDVAANAERSLMVKRSRKVIIRWESVVSPGVTFQVNQIRLD